MRPTINDLLTALVTDLLAGGVPHPLAQEFTLANVWYDLALLAGEEPPAAVLAFVEGSTVTMAPAFLAQLHAGTCHATYVAD